jgi:hypothetical protein
MAGAAEHPNIRYVVYPVHLDGTLTGAKPRLRHDPGCSHFEWRDGTHLGTPVLATDEQMRILNACKSCIQRRGKSPRDNRQSQSRAGNRTQAARGAYVDTQVIAAIKAHHASGRFDWAKLARLIDELNDNYARGSTYAVHAVLRAILDHIPPLLGSTTFTAAANNYPWSRTDKAYMKRLLDFRLQADDALHRQISAQTDLLSLGDIPPRAWINRLLQECASPSGTLKVTREDAAAQRGLNSGHEATHHVQT